MRSGIAIIRPLAAPRRFAAVQRVTGILLMLFSTSMLPSLLISLLRSEGVTRAFVDGFAATFLTGALILWPVRNVTAELKIRDGFLVVVLFWVVLSTFGAIPLYAAHVGWTSFVDALFESASGLTTTGATVAAGLDSMPWAILFYRAQLHWLGGMGVIVLAVALLPMLGIGGMQLFRAETPGPMKDAKLTPRIASTARALWIVYLTMTLLCGGVYWALGMPLFDAICHAMSTIATGGFANHDASIGYYASPAIEWAVVVFMAIGAMNFALHFIAWRERSLMAYLRDTEFRVFLFILLMLCALVCAPLWLHATYPTLGEAVRKGVFQLVAYGSSSGFATADPTGWPIYVPVLLVISGFMVGCAGSTAGGVKVTRLILFFKQAMRELRRLLHPSATIALKLGGRTVPDDIVYAVGGFFSVYVGLTILLTLVMIATGLDPVTAFSAVAACINNVGPGLGPVVSSMAGISDFGKWVLIVTMIMGRLEIFTFLIVFTPGFWRR